jgi:hypothetical protein
VLNGSAKVYVAFHSTKLFSKLFSKNFVKDSLSSALLKNFSQPFFCFGSAKIMQIIVQTNNVDKILAKCSLKGAYFALFQIS